MSNIEKIKAEIERRRDISVTFYEKLGTYRDNQRAKLCQELLDFIDSLPDEKPSEGLEEEVKRYYSDNFTYISSDQPTLSILTNIARHFTEWQKERMMDEWLKDRDGCFWDGVEEGKKAMEEQMMKDAKEIITVQGSLMEPEFVKQRVIFLKEG